LTHSRIAALRKGRYESCQVCANSISALLRLSFVFRELSDAGAVGSAQFLCCIAHCLLAMPTGNAGRESRAIESQSAAVGLTLIFGRFPQRGRQHE
jgi:hypothetical protein